MTKDGIKTLFNPSSIAVIGASQEEKHAGHAIFKNLIYGGYNGRVYPINPKYQSVMGSKCYQSIDNLPEIPDVAIIAIPAASVLSVLTSCGQKHIPAAIVISSGFSEAGNEGKSLFEDLKTIASQYNITMLGPNCLGYIRPNKKINASFATTAAKPGKIAFISQSGALCSAILDWANKDNVGFSYFVSVGETLDIGFAELIDFFGNDPETESILLYMESLSNVRQFLSAARSYARSKPIVVLKSGKSFEGAKAALSHTGSLAGNDAVFNAAFARVGILRVDTIGELFHCAEVLSTQHLPQGNRLAIVTNAGGPGVIATDYLMSHGGNLAQFSDETMMELSSFLPKNWSHGNPVDVLGDADSERYKKAIEICLKDEATEGMLVLLTPQAMTDIVQISKDIAALAQSYSKTIITSWMGEETVAAGKQILEQAHIPTYKTPETAVKSFINMYTYAKNLKLIQQTPGAIPHAFSPQTHQARVIIQKVLDEKRLVLTENEAKEVLSLYEIAVPDGSIAHTKEEATQVAEKIGYPVALKIVSPQILHKTEVKGQVLSIKTKQQVEEAFDAILHNVQSHMFGVDIKGILVEKMLPKKYELLIGSKKDPIFGPVIVFGSGGIAVEIFKDTAVALPPLNMALAKNLMEKTNIYQLLRGFRGIKAVDLASIEYTLYKFAYLVMDFPEINEVDINPFGVDEHGGIALDAKIILSESKTQTEKPYAHLVISPYPTEYIKKVTLDDGTPITLRPIKPEDEPMEAEMFEKFSDETQRFRFFTRIKDISHELLLRYTQIDYDREIAIIAEHEDNGKKEMWGVSRLIADPYNDTAEFAIVVADPWQKRRLGSVLTDYILQIAHIRKIKRVYAVFLPDNIRIKAMFENRGFHIRMKDDYMVAEKTLES